MRALLLLRRNKTSTQETGKKEKGEKKEPVV